MPAGGVCILDADNAMELVRLRALDIFSDTFFVRTGGEGFRGHFYFRCTFPDSKKIILYHPETGKELGDIRPSGCKAYCLGPGSIHPSGKLYTIGNDRPVREFSYDEICEKLFSKVRTSADKKENHPYAGLPDKNENNLVDELGLTVTEFLMPLNHTIRDSQVEGEHPVHGSETGTNLVVDPAKNIWYCRRHNSGGGPLEALAVSEGIIDCSKAGKGSLKGHWPEIFSALEKRGYGEKLKDLRDPKSPEYQKNKKKINDLPVITVNSRPLNEISEDAIRVLEEANHPPFLFHRGGFLVRIERDERNMVEIKQIREDALRGILARCARWISLKPVGKKKEDIRWIEKTENPPITVVKDILSLPPSVLSVPSLIAVTHSPIIHDDGTIIAEEGYDPKTRTYFAPEPGFVLEEIPDLPGDEDIRNALAILGDVFVDFPFVDSISKWNAVGALVTAVLRPVINGPVPCWIVDKPQAGSGASLIQGAIHMAATGRDPSIEVIPKSPDEWEKRTLATLLSGRNICILDNISIRLRSDIFAAILTSREWKGRILGKSEEVSLPVRCFWMANGNNIQFGGDIPRRIWASKIDPQMALPWQRDGFRHPDLLKWIQKNRGEIVAAVFILAKAWITAGRPKPEKIMPIGGFEEWRHTIGGILENAGVEDFMQNAMNVYLDGDVELRQWENFISSVFEVFGTRPWTAADLYRRLNSEDTGESLNPPIRVMDTLPDHLAEIYISKPTGFTRACGNALSKQEGRRFPCGYMIRRGQTRQSAQQWIIAETGKNSAAGNKEEVNDDKPENN
jgi:hypothetical protein